MDEETDGFEELPHAPEIEDSEEGLRPTLLRLEECRQAIMSIPDQLLPGHQDDTIRALKEAVGSVVLALESLDREVYEVRSSLRIFTG